MMKTKEQISQLTIQFHRDRGLYVLPIHRNAVNTGR
jgi:hypothetical protein